MPINENYLTFNLPFSYNDFCNLTEEAYQSELFGALNRAKWIMITQCVDHYETWGIDETDYYDDVSGQLQIALEFLTAAEFLKKYIAFFSGTIKLIGLYQSPTKERLDKNSSSIEAYDDFYNRLFMEAYAIAYPWVRCRIKHIGLMSAKSYDWQSGEWEYHQNIFPSYNPKPYWNNKV